MQKTSETTTRTVVSMVDFGVPTSATIGPRFPSWLEAVHHARTLIQRMEYPGQVIRPQASWFHPRRYFQEGGTLVVYSRSFVQMRVTEPVQGRPGSSVRSGVDRVAASWEVFHDGTTEEMPSSVTAGTVVRDGQRNFTCGACGETFGTNCAEDDIECAVCGAKRCPHCHRWFGRDD